MTTLRLVIPVLAVLIAPFAPMLRELFLRTDVTALPIDDDPGLDRASLAGTWLDALRAATSETDEDDAHSATRDAHFLGPQQPDASPAAAHRPHATAASTHASGGIGNAEAPWHAQGLLLRHAGEIRIVAADASNYVLYATRSIARAWPTRSPSSG